MTKLRIAQINTSIGVIKNSIKTLEPTDGGAATPVGGASHEELQTEESQAVKAASEEQKKHLNVEKARLKKMAATWMDGISKQIDALSDKYKQNMNRYEKSISMLHTAQNMIHENCQEFTEI